MKQLGFDLILLGAPASGKDTQALILRKEYKLKPVESGKYWRKLAKQNSPVGRILRRTSERGNPTPVRLMKKFLIDNVSKVSSKIDLVFIGNPRLKPEAQLLVKLLKKKKRDFLAVYIDLPEKLIWKRSLTRKEIRKDTDYISNRVRYHKSQVKKTVEYFKQLKCIKIIDGSKSISAVASDIRKILNDYQKSRAGKNTPRRR
jgi:adenylate kinase